jgi:peptide/nickel transport system ATP-binding protein
MFAGEFVEGGDAMELLAKPAHPYTRLLISAVPDPKRTAPFDPVERAQLRRQVLHPTECAWSGKTAEPCSAEKAVFHRLSDKPEHWVRCGLYAPPADAPGTALEQAADDEENDAA